MRHRLHQRDDGLAMIAVAMLGTALILISTVVFARGLAQFGNTRGDAVWEQSLASAEAGLDWALSIIEADDGFTTGEELPAEVIGSSQEKEWVIAAADLHPDSDVVHASDGEFVVVKPSNGQFVYSVGYAPHRDHPQRRVRVVRVDYDTIPHVTTWIARLAFLAGQDVEFRGNPTFLTGASVGIHANGFIDLGGSTFSDGCVTASGGSKVTGGFTQPPGCPTPGSQATMFIPEVNPRAHWDESEYDLCPDGKVRAGPAHPVYGTTATAIPCQGQTLTSSAATSPYRGWEFAGCCDVSHWARWRYTSTQANDGVYYVHQGRANLVSSPGSDLIPWKLTLIVEARGVCPGLQGGDILVSGSPDLVPYPGTGNLQFIAGRDIDFAGNPDFTGLAAAHEQIEITGDLDVHEGSLLAADWCESVGDFVDASYMGGNGYVTNTGPIATEIGATVELLTATSWTEL